MARCKYCGENAGLYVYEHESCASSEHIAKQKIREAIDHLVRDEISSERFLEVIENVSMGAHLEETEFMTTTLTCLDFSVRAFSFEAPVPEPTLDRLLDLYRKIHPNWERLSTEEKSRLPGYLTLLHSSTLWDVLNGSVPFKRAPGMASEFNLLIGEAPIVERYAQLGRTEKRVSPFLQAISIPMGLGLYYTVTKSTPRAAEQLRSTVHGKLLLTTNNIRFRSADKSLSIPYASVHQLSPYLDGFEIVQDSRKITFMPSPLGTIDEGWFFYNIVAALAPAAIHV